MLIDAGLHGRVLENTRFPAHGIHLLEHDQVHARLIDEFTCWQATDLIRQSQHLRSKLATCRNVIPSLK